MTIDQLDKLPSQDGPLLFYRPDGSSLDLSNHYQGRAVFLTLPGPSLADMNLEALKRPGVVTLGVNNSPATIRPDLWTCVDPPGRFHDRFQRDPRITKLYPLALAAQRLRWKDPQGVFQASRLRPCDCPSALFYRRHSGFEAADFFSQNSVAWGCMDGETDSLGIKGMRNVMLAALKLAHALGFRTVYLCGCDFRMAEGAKNYSFEEDRSNQAVKHNVHQYQAMAKRLEALKPYLDMEGVQVFNCTPGSGLSVFPFRRLGEAVEEATRDCGGELDCKGWYKSEKAAKEEADREVAHLREHGGGD